MDISLILSTKYSDCEWSHDGESYDGLTWLDNSPKPTESELQAQWLEVHNTVSRKAIQSSRRAQYQLIADPLFFGWQRGDNTEQEWLDAVQAVKNDNPYPDEPVS